MFDMKAFFEKGGVQGDEALTVTFSALEHDLTHMKPLFEAIIKTVLVPYVRAKFQEEGAAWMDAPWTELMASTVKRRGGSSHPILDDPTHDKDRRGGPKLKDTFIAGDEHVEEVTETTMVWGSRHRAATHHQQGTRYMVPRRILEMNPEVRAKIKVLVKAYIIAVAKKAGFRVQGDSK